MNLNTTTRPVFMVVATVIWLAVAGTVATVRGQDLVCCNTWIDADGNWFGARRDCKAALQELSAASRAKACQQIKKIKPPPKNAPWFKPFAESASQAGCCPEAADACGDPSMNCTAASPPDRGVSLPLPSGSPSPEEKPCKAENVSLEVSRYSLIETSSTGDPDPGANPAFKYTANPSSAVTYTTSDANANPNTGGLKAAANPNITGEPSPGALAELTVTYTCKAGTSATKKFSVATFGLSCYVLADENDWILATPAPTPTPSPSPTESPSTEPSPAPEASPAPTPTPSLNCKSQRIGATRYAGVTKDPTGLPKGEYCTAFLADVRLQGSGTARDGTKVAYVSGNNPNWVFKTITDFTGADGRPLIENGSVARDRQIVGGKGNTTVKLESGDFLANDTGGAIRGYRLDVFGGTGQKACKNFKNRIEVGACNPGSAKCPELKSPIP